MRLPGGRVQADQQAAHIGRGVTLRRCHTNGVSNARQWSNLPAPAACGGLVGQQKRPVPAGAQDNFGAPRHFAMEAVNSPAGYALWIGHPPRAGINAHQFSAKRAQPMARGCLCRQRLRSDPSGEFLSLGRYGEVSGWAHTLCRRG
jgi:hypothetical protein